jgi:hypothetical protein
MTEPDRRTVDEATIEKWLRYKTARDAKSRWTAEEKAAKADLMDALGYDPDDTKPVPTDVVDESGEPVCSVRVGSRKGLDIQYLKSRHPDVYAECEKWTFPISVKDPAE